APTRQAPKASFPNSAVPRPPRPPRRTQPHRLSDHSHSHLLLVGENRRSDLQILCSPVLRDGAARRNEEQALLAGTTLGCILCLQCLRPKSWSSHQSLHPLNCQLFAITNEEVNLIRDAYRRLARQSIQKTKQAAWPLGIGFRGRPQRINLDDM